MGDITGRISSPLARKDEQGAMKKKVLLVDDDRKLVEMLAAGLQRMDMEIKTASNGVEALDVAWDFQPDIVIMDIMMPMIDGMEAASVLKNHPRTNRIPIIFISGKSTPSEATETLGEAYMAKPFRVEDLAVRIHSILKERESLDKEIKEDKGFFGKLSLIGIPDLIQIMEQGRNTGTLTLTSQGREGVIHFQEGRVLDAVSGERKGKWAVFHLLSWEKGDFSFRSERPSASAAIQSSGTELVLEGMRRFDERQRLVSKLPDLRTVLVVKGQVKEKLGSKKLSPDLNSFLQMFDGKKTLEEIIDQGGEDELETVERLIKVHSAGLLEEKPTEVKP
jgi:DNA-binding response OmpR family regulator